MRVEALFRMNDVEFDGYAPDAAPDAGPDPWIAARNETLARYVLLWLETKGWLWPFYRALRDSQGKDRTGVESFRAVTGMSPEEATPLWVDFARKI